MKMEKLEQKLISICEEVSVFIAGELGKVSKSQIEVKDLNSLVSYVDKTAEGLLVTKLSVLLPQAGFITEEDTTDPTQRSINWVIDPLDGTNNFLHQIPHFAISVALLDKGEILLGVVYDVMRNECFHARLNGGAYLNNTQIRVSSTDSLNNTLLATGFPYTNTYNSGSLVDILSYWLKHTRGVRRMGAAALDLAYVACGRFDAYYETRLNIWDIAAGALIVKEAGGCVSDFSGGSDYLSGKQIISSNNLIYSQIKNVINLHYN